jgi:aminoglycoside 6-adenylyltransferase
MKELLLKLIEWHTHASNGWDYDTWHRGSFLEEWASPRIIESLQNVYAHYNENDAWDALNETINLFRTLSSEFAGLLDYQYPADIDNCITKLINSIRIAD